jgi:NDP-sugar pyrophosphorylase family protein
MTRLTSSLPLYVLAGGLGTRLQSVLGGAPKALASVNGRPFLSFQIENWLKQGIRSFVFLLHYQADVLVDYLKSEENKLLKDSDVQFSVEPQPMGTGGAVAYAIKQMDLVGDFLLVNADTWIGSGIVEMMNAPSPSILVIKSKNTSRYGEVIFNERQIVTAFLEKNTKSNIGWINAGIGRMNSSFFINWNEQPFSLEEYTFPHLVEKKALIAVNCDTDFIDIGVPKDYLRFCHWIDSGKKIRL